MSNFPACKSKSAAIIATGRVHVGSFNFSVFCENWSSYLIIFKPEISLNISDLNSHTSLNIIPLNPAKTGHFFANEVKLLTTF